MKIFSNFDTKWKSEAYNEMVEKYWKKNVLILHKSLLFLSLKVLLPLIWGFVVLFVLWALLFFNLDEDLQEVRIAWTFFMLCVYTFLIWITQVVKYYIDYKMDFSLVTPEYLTRYNQTGFFRRDIKSSYVRNIKTISITKNDTLYNIFDNGNLIFLSEWDRGWEDWKEWEIVLHYIKDPEAKKKEIIRIMKIFS